MRKYYFLYLLITIFLGGCQLDACTDYSDSNMESNDIDSYYEVSISHEENIIDDTSLSSTENNTLYANIINPIQIVDDIEEWERVDILAEGIPEDSGYLGATANGFFYRVITVKSDEGPLWTYDWKYFFYSWDGEITCVFYEENKSEQSYSSCTMTDNSLLLAIQHEEGVTTYQVYEDGTVEEIYTQTGYFVPWRYCTNEFIYFTQFDFMADGREVSKVLKYDRHTSELEVIYETVLKNGAGRIVSRIGGTDQEVFLAVVEYKDRDNESMGDHYVVKLDPDTKTVLDEIKEQYGILTINGNENKVLIAENAYDEPLEESGKIYIWEKGLLSNAVTIPGWSASTPVNYPLLSGNRIIMLSTEHGYIWDLETDIIHSLAIRWYNIENFSGLTATNGFGLSSRGFSGLMLREDGMHWVEMRLK